MNFTFSNDKPIYIQLIDIFKINIISGLLSEGTKLDSVRDLAIAAKVNPNTMQKALSELENIGLVRTERTSGKFITNDKEKIILMRKEIAIKEIEAFLRKMQSLGFKTAEIIQMIEEDKN